jgi:predicted NBD/HSP70 family sugar kinase
VECFAAWGLLRAGTEAIDVPRVAAVLTGGTAPQRRQRTAIARAVAGALCSITAVLNPQAVVIGGPWASVGGFDELVADEIRAASAVAVEVRRDSLGQRGPLLGAQIQAVRAAQRSLVSRFT